MTLRIEIDMGNAAFDDAYGIEHVLANLAERWEGWTRADFEHNADQDMVIHDYNGNYIGKARASSR